MDNQQNYISYNCLPDQSFKYSKIDLN